MDAQGEVEQLIKELSFGFAKAEVGQSQNNKNSRDNNNIECEFKIWTNEGLELKILLVMNQGFIVMQRGKIKEMKNKDDVSVYDEGEEEASESLEQLLMNESLSFKQKWNERLFSKLNNLKII